MSEPEDFVAVDQSDMADGSEPEGRPGVLANSFFDGLVFSDVTVHFGDEIIRAHKIKLAEGSPYSKRVLTGGGNQEDPSEIYLYNDDASAVRGLIAHFYKLLYDGVGSFDNNTRKLLDPTEPAEAADYAIYLIGLYAAANKYEVQLLKVHISARFPMLLQTVAKAVEPAAHLAKLTQHVYITHSDEAAELRCHIICTLSSDMDEIDDFLSNVPSVAAELVRALAAKARKPTQSTSTPQTGTKRPAEGGLFGRPSEPLAMRSSPSLANAPPLEYGRLNGPSPPMLPPPPRDLSGPLATGSPHVASNSFPRSRASAATRWERKQCAW